MSKVIYGRSERFSYFLTKEQTKHAMSVFLDGEVMFKVTPITVECIVFETIVGPIQFTAMTGTQINEST